MTMLSQDDLDKLVPAESMMFASPIPVQSVSSDEFLPEVPEEIRRKYGYAPLGAADGPVKNAIFGENNARLYNVKPQLRAAIKGDQLTRYKTLYAEHGAGRTNLAYGYVLKDAG